MSCVLTFDLGTTFFKACLFDEDGRLLALAHAATPIDHPRPRWKQIAPQAFLDVLRDLAADLKRQDPDAWPQVTVISFATQTNSFLLLDERDEPLTPIILWNDQRAADVADQLQSLNDGDAYRQQTGLPSMNLEFAAAKLLWLGKHEPDVLRKAAKFRLIGDHLTWWLTGAEVTEAGAAGLTGLLDIHRVEWRVPAIEAVGLTLGHMPRPARAGTAVGTLRAALAQDLDLSESCRVVLGCLDQYAGAIGAGNVVPGGLSETTGTVLATVTLATRFDESLPDTVPQGPAWEAGLYWRMSVGGVSAQLLEALRAAEPEPVDVAALVAEAADVPPGAQGVSLDLEASERAAAPVLTGLNPTHSRGHRVRAVLEGVAEALVRQTRDLGQDPMPTTIRSVGGAARSDVWLQIKADALGMQVAAMQCPEPTSLGAAAIALSTTQQRPLAQVANRLAQVRRTFTPSDPPT